jgi:Ca2+-binding RTX toxin-like protein
MEGLHEKKKEKQMRRTIVLLTTMAMTLLVATSVAMAATISCPDNPTNGIKCTGTIGDDKMTGTDRIYWDGVEGVSWSDDIFGYEGNDAIYARGGPDYVYGGPGNDLIYGDSGDDRIFGDSGDDRIAGGPGNDYIYGDGYSGNNDYGAVGKDTANFYSSPAAITASLATNVATGEGSDTMRGIENLVGSKYNDTLTGSIGPNTLRGYEGKDSYYGIDGNDTINTVDSTADGIISCGPGYDKVDYDKSLDVPSSDCELQRPF